MFIAKSILDDFTCSIPNSPEDASQLTTIILQDYKHPEDLKELYHVDNLSRPLRYHKDENEEDVTDQRELAVRQSFDVIIDFYGKLEYLKKIGYLSMKNWTISIIIMTNCRNQKQQGTMSKDTNCL